MTIWLRIFRDVSVHSHRFLRCYSEYTRIKNKMQTRVPACLKNTVLHRNNYCAVIVIPCQLKFPNRKKMEYPKSNWTEW